MNEATNFKEEKLMSFKEMADFLEYQFSCHRAYIKIKPYGTYVNGSKSYVFKVKPKAGTKLNYIFGCISDIKACLQCSVFELSINKGQIYLIVSINPNNDNRLLPILESQTFRGSEMKLPVIFGYDSLQMPFMADLAEMPHILYGGATGMGKSVALRNLILSIIWKNSAQRANLVIFDTEANDLDMFDGIQHLSHPIVKDELTSVYVIGEIVKEMERRMKLSDDELDKLPEIVLIIDEMVSLSRNMNKKLFQFFSNAITDFLRRGRHAKIHIAIGAQDPTKENLKISLDNITTRVAFRCNSRYSSQVIIGQSGAECLGRKGEMLFTSVDYPVPKRIHGTYITMEELKCALSHIKNSGHDLSNKFVIPEVDISQMQSGNPRNFYISDISVDDSENKKFADIIMWTLSNKKVSANKLADIFHMGNKAHNIINSLCDMKIVSEQNAKQPRTVVPTCVDDISDDVLEFLSKYGYSKEVISDAISNRV